MSLKKFLYAGLIFSLLASPLNLNSYSEAPHGKEGFMMFNLAEEPAAKTPLKVLNARIVIDAPPVFVWHTLTNYNKLKDILPGYKKTDVVSADASGKIIDVVMNVAALLPTYNYRVRVNENKSSYELKMNRIAGDFNHLSATYQLYPKNNGSQTILAYSIKIDPGKKTFPTFGLSPILKNNTANTLKAIQNHAEQEHKKSLIGQR